jgi:hypothetical protein
LDAFEFELWVCWIQKLIIFADSLHPVENFSEKVLAENGQGLSFELFFYSKLQQINLTKFDQNSPTYNYGQNVVVVYMQKCIRLELKLY